MTAPPTEAVEAAARAWLGVKPDAPFDMDGFRKTYPHAAIERGLTAALPLLRAQILDEAAADIRADAARLLAESSALHAVDEEAEK